MRVELNTSFDYDPGKTQDFFESRGWKVDRVPINNLIVVAVDEGAAAECIDGRHGKFNQRKKNGAKMPGGINSIAAMVTGGDIVGYNHAAKILEVKFNLKPGTHGECGFYEKWIHGLLESTTFAYSVVEQLKDLTLTPGKWIKLKQRFWGGKHWDKLPGQHEEKGLCLNPFLGTTVIPRADRFSYDKWVLRELGLSEQTALSVVAETIEKLDQDPSHRLVEIIVP